ncbi:NADP(H)-dependent aldo-keto reductase [Limibacillus halophilus]
MDYRPLGRSGIEVSSICLGSMTWGEQNTEAEGHEQMDYAFEQGVNFIDVAEMYSTPPRAETFGRSEEVIGSWMAARGNRDKVILASKVLGPSTRFGYVRDGKPRLNRTHIMEAIEGSLRRLKTDYLDLYQLHWPDRSTNTFGRLGFEPDPEEESIPIEETLEVLEELVTAGKVRSIGLSNETPWGTMRFLALAEQGKGPRVVSVQNPYSLLNRSYEAGMAEVSIREDCGLLAYAPLAAGTLSGKYLNGQRPEGARMTLYPQNDRYMNEQGQAAVGAYVSVADKHGLDPVHMAHAWVLSRPFVTSSIIGATSMEQLKRNFGALETTLSPEALSDIEAVHKRYTYPCP